MLIFEMVAGFPPFYNENKVKMFKVLVPSDGLSWCMIGTHSVTAASTAAPQGRGGSLCPHVSLGCRRSAT